MNENRETFETELSETEVLEGEVREEKPHRELPMRWHKFLIYFSMWLAAIQNIFSFCTRAYTLLKVDPAIWSAIPKSYIVVCMLNLSFYVAVTIYLIYVRFALARFRKNAPRLMLRLYAVNMVGYLFFLFAINLSLSSSPFTNFRIEALIGPVFFILINNKYYYRRRHLFVN